MSDIAVRPLSLSHGDWFAATPRSLGHERLLSATDVRAAGSNVASRGVDAATSNWIAAVNEQLTNLVLLEDEWDSYGSPPPTADAVHLSVELLKALSDERLPVPRVRATADGGVTVEWYGEAIELVFEVEPAPGVVVFFRDRSSGNTIEGSLGDALDAVATALHRLRSAS